MLERWYLCVDAGGTKTAAAIANQRGEIVAEGWAGPANMAELGCDCAAKEILLATARAVDYLYESKPSNGGLHVGIEYRCPVTFERAWIGISGCDSPLDPDIMQGRLQSSFIRPVVVMNDALLLSSFCEAHQSEWCCAVVAGTGSITLGVTSAGSFVKRGGYGHLFGDAGSGYDLGLSAIRMAVEDYDASEEVSGGLSKVLRARFGVKDTGDLPSRAHDMPLDLDPISASNARKLRIAELSKDVLTLASTCPLARKVVDTVAAGLAEDIAFVYRLSKQKGLDHGGLAITGGLGVQQLYLDAVLEQLKRRSIEFNWLEKVVSPARQGAAALSKIR